MNGDEIGEVILRAASAEDCRFCEVEALWGVRNRYASTFDSIMRMIFMMPEGAMTPGTRFRVLILFRKLGCGFDPAVDEAFFRRLIDWCSGLCPKAMREVAASIIVGNPSVRARIPASIEGEYCAQALILRHFVAKTACFDASIAGFLCQVVLRNDVPIEARMDAAEALVIMKKNSRGEDESDKLEEWIIQVVKGLSNDIVTVTLYGKLLPAVKKDDPPLTMILCQIVPGIVNYFVNARIEIPVPVYRTIARMLQYVAFPLTRYLKTGDRAHAREIVIAMFRLLEPLPVVRTLWMTSPEQFYIENMSGEVMGDYDEEEEEEMGCADAEMIEQSIMYVFSQGEAIEMIYDEVCSVEVYDYKTVKLISIGSRPVADDIRMKMANVRDELAVFHAWMHLIRTAHVCPPVLLFERLWEMGNHVGDMSVMFLLNNLMDKEYDPRIFVTALAKCVRYLGENNGFETANVVDYIRNIASFICQCLQVERIQMAFAEYYNLMDLLLVLWKSMFEHASTAEAISEIGLIFKAFATHTIFHRYVAEILRLFAIECESALVAHHGDFQFRSLLLFKLTSTMMTTPVIVTGATGAIDGIVMRLVHTYAHVESRLPPGFLDSCSYLVMKGMRCDIVPLVLSVLEHVKPSLSQWQELFTLMFVCMQKVSDDASHAMMSYTLRSCFTGQVDARNYLQRGGRLLIIALYLSDANATRTLLEGSSGKPFANFFEVVISNEPQFTNDFDDRLLALFLLRHSTSTTLPTPVRERVCAHLRAFIEHTTCNSISLPRESIHFTNVELIALVDPILLSDHSSFVSRVNSFCSATP